MEDTKYFLLTQVSFVILSVICLLLIDQGLRKALSASSLPFARQKRIRTLFVSSIVAWVAILTVLSVSGFLQDFSTFPPRMFVVLVVPLVSIVVITFSSGLKNILRFTPPHWLVYIQSFRIVVEILLWLLFLDTLVPEQMTFEGRNLDVITGILAIPAGYLMVKYKKYAKTTGILFNIIGLALLINILSIAILSMPTPFRVFMNEPANSIVAYFPIVLLPGILVPVAYAMHFFSLRQLLMKPVPFEKEQDRTLVAEG